MKEKNNLIRKRIMSIMIIALLSMSILTVMFTYKAEATTYTIYNDADDSTNTANNKRSIMRGLDGRLHCVFIQRSNDQIYYTNSSDNGASWTAAVQLTNTGFSQQSAALAVDSLNNVHIVYSGLPGGGATYKISYINRTNATGVWSTPLALTATSTTRPSFSPSIAIDSDDHLHVVWYGNYTGIKSYQIRYRNFTGGTWSTITNITTYNTKQQYLPSIAIDSTDTLHVTWSGNHTGTSIPQIRYTKNTGTGWSAPINLTSEATTQSYPCIAIDATDSVHIVWQGIFSGMAQTQIRYIKYSSGTWSAITNITTYSSYEQGIPSISINLNSYMHVVWQGKIAGLTYNQIRAINYTGSWGTIWNVTTNTNNDQITPITAYSYYPLRNTKPLNIFPIGFCFTFVNTFATDLMFTVTDDIQWTVINPTITTNTATGIEETNATLQGTLTNDGGDSCTVRFQYGLTTSYGTNTTNQTKTTGQTFNINTTSLTPGNLYHYRAVTNNSNGTAYGADQTFITKPDAPTSATPTFAGTTITLTWTNGAGANTTRIERNTVATWSVGAGTLLYNGTGTTYDDTTFPYDPDNGQINVYYRYWSYTTWGTENQYSDPDTEHYHAVAPTSFYVEQILLPLVIGVILVAILITWLFMGELSLKFLIGWLILAIFAISILQLIFSI